MEFKKYISDMECDSYGNDHGNSGNIIFDCSLGVNPFGYSKRADRCIEKIDFKKLHDYPSDDFKIRRSIAEYWSGLNITPENVFMGSGSIGCLDKINKLILSVGDKVLGYGPQFPDYEFSVASMGGDFHYISMVENNCVFDCEKFIESMSNEYKIIYLDNPNNPTGQIIPLYEIDEILKASQKFGCFVIVDEAYGEFMKSQNSAINLIDKYGNLIIAKSFSKGYGMAGLRMGYLVVSDEIMKQLNKIAIPFSVNFMALEVGEALFGDRKFIDESMIKTEKIKRKFLEEIKSVKVMNTSLSTPILTIVHPDKDMDIKKALGEKGVKIVSGKSFRELSKNCGRIRISEDYAEIARIINSII